MLEKSYTIPVLFGVCLGIILACVQVSATALNAAVGHHRDIGLVVFESVDRHGVAMQVLGKGLKINFSAPGEQAEFTGAALERAAGFYYRWHEKANPAGEFIGRLVGQGREVAGKLRERWKRFIQ